MKESRSKQLDSLLSRVLIQSIFTLLSLLACFGSSYHLKETPGDVGPATLVHTHTLTEDCNQIHDDLRRAFFSTNQTANVTIYRVRLKLFTTHKDTLEILAMPAMADVTPIAIFDKDKHRGFTANLSKEQVCELYHLPTVSNITPCRSASSSQPLCQPTEYILALAMSGLGLNSKVVNITTDTSRLAPSCAVIIQQIFTNVVEEGYVRGRFFAGIKSFVPREKAEDLFYSPEMNGTGFVRHEEQMWSSNVRKRYEGRWNFTQVCDLEHRSEVSYVGTKVMWEPMDYRDYQG